MDFVRMILTDEYTHAHERLNGVKLKSEKWQIVEAFGREKKERISFSADICTDMAQMICCQNVSRQVNISR